MSFVRRWSNAASSGALFGAALILSTAPAAAYRTAGDHPDFAGAERVRWEKRSVSFELHTAIPEELRAGDVTAEVERAFSTWHETDCQVPALSLEGSTSVDAAPGDGVNTLQWIHSGWTSRGLPADAAGASDVQYERLPGGDWTIVEADLYLNADRFQWIVRGPGPEGVRAAESVLTHEMGHVLGLGHPCEPSGRDAAPDCAGHAEMQGVAMYPLYAPTQRTLSADDVAGVCFLYEGCARGACGDPDGGGTTRGVDGGGPGIAGAWGVNPVGTLPRERHDGGSVRLKETPETCAESSECASGLCVTGAPEGPFCSHPCASDDECPSEWSCEEVDDTPVCAPVFVRAGGGCSSSGSGSGDSAPWIVPMLFLLFGRLRNSASSPPGARNGSSIRVREETR